MSIPAEFEGNERFQMLSRLGAGGMGVVYEALDRDNGRKVALKTLRGVEPSALYRLKNEFRSLQDLHHPNLVRYEELFEHHGRWFFTMELLRGHELMPHVRPSSFRRPSSSAVHAVSLARTETVTPTQELFVPDGSSGPMDAGLGPDLERLRDVLRQLTGALLALHAAGLVHRDVKPSNVIVTREGRAVLLDFGLAHGTGVSVRRSSPQLVGTVAYMAPEQAASKPASPASDWYAVGVLLYEVLTGRLPHSGTPLQILADKQSVVPVAPGALVPGLPEDLCALCMELLTADPAQRPGDEQVALRLGVDPATERARTSFRTHLQYGSGVFVGRGAELARLDEAFQAVRGGECRVVRVRGESGMGKTALVRQFCQGLDDAGIGVVVLAGRCYERESVPYRGMDGVIDALSRHLASLPRGEAAAVVPRRAALLRTVFPVMEIVPEIAAAPTPRERAGDPQEVRHRAFGALRSLLASLADRCPLVLVIDDLQWLDVESALLLGELLRPPEAPALLLLITERPETSRGTQRRPLELGQTPLEVELGPLDLAESRELARALAPDGSRDRPGFFDAVGDEARGHPMFIHELVRHARKGGQAPVALETALAGRIDMLSMEARRLLDLLAVAGAPVHQQVAQFGAELDAAAFETALSTLREENLVVTSGTSPTDHVQTCHDRVRELSFGRLGEQERVRWHAHIAGAMERSPLSELDALADHWMRAGERDKAASFARRAAEQAAAALAFERAAALYRTALEGKPAPELVAELTRHLADALANAGRGKEAAHAYLEAARLHQGSVAQDLRRRAADQFLRTGYIDEGLQTARVLLEELGMRFFDSPRTVLASLLLQRGRLAFRGLRYSLRNEAQVPPQDLLRIDLCWMLANGVSLTEPLRAAEFQARSLLLALQAGEPKRIVRSMAVLAYLSSLESGASRGEAQKLMRAAEELGANLQGPEIEGWLCLARGVNALVTGDFVACHDNVARAERVFRHDCSGVPWEVVSSQTFRLWSLAYRGRLREIAQQLPALIDIAQRRGDRHALMGLRLGPLHLVGLAADEPERVRRETEQTLADWPARVAHFQHMCALFVQAQVDLYQRDPARALARLDQDWWMLRSTMMLRVQFFRIDFHFLRARAALACAAAAPGKGERSSLLARAGRDLAQLAGEHLAWADGSVLTLRAGIASLAGDLEGARRELTRADAHYAAIQMTVHQACARLQLARLGGAEAEVLRQEAETSLAAEGVRNPSRMAGLWVPGAWEARRNG
jgi:hypothetical protein